MSDSSRGMRVAICDYGVGNLHSLAKALAGPSICVRVESDPVAATDRRMTDLLVLPGVGAFTAAAERLELSRPALRAAAAGGFPLVGICLGMQLFFQTSEEGPGEGLGLLAGRVRRLRARRVPQIGWNQLTPEGRREPLLSEKPLNAVYYANSFVCEPEDERCVTAWSEHEGDRFPAAVRGGPTGNVVGMQFHPEKSSAAGVQFLRDVIVRAGTGVSA